MRRRPIIGISTQTLHSIDGIPEVLPESWVMNQRYSRVVAAAGGLPVMIPLLDEEEALRGLYETAKAKPGYFGRRVLFLHTGGGFGLFKLEESEWAEK